MLDGDWHQVQMGGLDAMMIMGIGDDGNKLKIVH